MTFPVLIDPLLFPFYKADLVNSFNVSLPSIKEVQVFVVSFDVISFPVLLKKNSF